MAESERKSANLSAREQANEIRLERERLLEQVRHSEETIRKSRALIARLDALLAKLDESGH